MGSKLHRQPAAQRIHERAADRYHRSRRGASILVDSVRFEIDFCDCHLIKRDYARYAKEASTRFSSITFAHNFIYQIINVKFYLNQLCMYIFFKYFSFIRIVEGSKLNHQSVLRVSIFYCMCVNILIIGWLAHDNESRWQGGPVNCIQKQRSRLLRVLSRQGNHCGR